MSGQLPEELINTFRSFNDVTLEQFGIKCDLYIPTNLTANENTDMYAVPETQLTYATYLNQDVWIEWYIGKYHRLRKLGIFGENETPVVARFKRNPVVTVNSYIKVESRYIPDTFDIDEFEITDILMSNFYDSEVYRYVKLNPRRVPQ